MAKQIINSENLILQESIQPELESALKKLQEKLKEPTQKTFYHFKTLKTHILPLTNVAFDKLGAR